MSAIKPGSGMAPPVDDPGDQWFEMTSDALGRGLHVLALDVDPVHVEHAGLAADIDGERAGGQRDRVGQQPPTGLRAQTGPDLDDPRADRRDVNTVNLE